VLKYRGPSEDVPGLLFGLGAVPDAMAVRHAWRVRENRQFTPAAGVVWENCPSLATDPGGFDA